MKANSYFFCFKSLLRQELAKGVTELGENPADYELADEPSSEDTVTQSVVPG
jgi:hypothetical protein